MYKYKKLLFGLFIATTSQIFAQNVGINTTAPDASAALEIKNANKGLLIPRVSLLTVTDNVTIPSPAISLLVFNTNSSISSGAGYYFNNGTTTAPVWKKFISSDDIDVAFAARSGYNDVLPNVSQVLKLESEDFDLSGNFWLSGSIINPNTFTAPVNGVYHFDASIKWEINGAVSPITINTWLRVNGSNRINFSETHQNTYTTHVNGNVLLNAGEKVNIYVSHSYPTLISFGACYFSGNILLRL